MSNQRLKSAMADRGGFSDRRAVNGPSDNWQRSGAIDSITQFPEVATVIGTRKAARAANEVWLPIPNYEGLYEVSNLGLVRALLMRTRYGASVRQPPLILAPAKLRNGYLKVTLSGRDGERDQRLVHRIVLEVFHGPQPSGQEGSHLNGQRPDNRAENLGWETRSENHARKLEHGTAQRGERAPRVTLSSDQVLYVRRRYVRGSKINGGRQIARELGVSQFCIQAILSGKNWNHLGGA